MGHDIHFMSRTQWAVQQQITLISSVNKKVGKTCHHLLLNTRSSFVYFEAVLILFRPFCLHFHTVWNLHFLSKNSKISYLNFRAKNLNSQPFMVVCVGPSKINALALLSSSLMALISAKTRAICCQTAGGQKLKKWTKMGRLICTW